MKKVINVAELSGKQWRFIEPYYTGPAVDWQYVSGVACNPVERAIQRPKISRYRACFQAASKLSNPDTIIISHMPRLSQWQSTFMKLAGRRNPHMAFAFNFTELPTGFTHKAMIKSFQRIDQFVVYSQFERERYAEYFNIPIEKIHMLHWAMNTPTTDNLYNPLQSTAKVTPEKNRKTDEYYCAVGGEGRDYETLIETFRKLPELTLVIVTRPYAFQASNLPKNVIVKYNLSSPQFWQVVAASKAVIIPLLDEKTACGHISLVGAMTLNKPIISSFSHGTSDYLTHESNSLIVPTRDAKSLQSAVEQLENDQVLRQKLALSNQEFTQEHCQPTRWAKHVQQFIEQH